TRQPGDDGVLALFGSFLQRSSVGHNAWGIRKPDDERLIFVGPIDHHTIAACLGALGGRDTPFIDCVVTHPLVLSTRRSIARPSLPGSCRGPRVPDTALHRHRPGPASSWSRPMGDDATAYGCPCLAPSVPRNLPSGDRL